MSLSCSQVSTTEDFEMSDITTSLIRSQSEAPQSPAWPLPASQSPVSPSLAYQPSVSRFLNVPNPSPVESSEVFTAENAFLPRPDSSVRMSTSPTASHRPRTPRSLYKSSISPWHWEMASLLIATGILVAMMVILSGASNQPEQNWNLPITLSALVNTLSTVYRALVAYVAVEIVNQQKWIWLWSTSPYRPLRHIQYFEAGSRGLLGALRLMPLVAKSSPGSLLALIVIVLSLAVGPFAQQSIGTEYLTTSTGIASLPVTYSLDSVYFSTNTDADVVSWSLTASTRGALFSALANPGSNDSTIPVDCPTGNCKFWGWRSQPQKHMTHASVGMCRRCHDVTSLVSVRFRHDLGGYTHGLPNGMEIMTSSMDTPWLIIKSDSNLSWAGSVIPVERAAQMSWSFTNTTVFTMGPGTNQDMNDPKVVPSVDVAVSCSLYPCLRTYSASIDDGRLVEDELESIPLYPDLGNYNGTDVDGELASHELFSPSSEIDLAAIQSPCFINHRIFTTENMSTAIGAVPVRILSPDNAPDYPTIMAPKECTFRLKSSSYLILKAVYSEQLLNGNCTWSLQQGKEIECSESWWLAQFWETKTASVGSVKDRFGAIADATTNQFRLGVGREPNSTDKVYGYALDQVAYTVFHWQWFALPVLLLVIDVLLVWWMLYRSILYCSEEMPWKGNLLPLLYYKSLFEESNGESFEAQAGFGGDTEDDGPLLTAAELEDVSQKVFIRLRRGNSHLAEVEEDGY